ncbi:PLP-dependent aminotransferase family protein [Rhizobiaceae bacterium n13]|uniref:PLP-dependent aminotransferase family protein n=1 Tax=Ferirhizobium litorale TaxID=2927786 RepID=A0AAE3U4F0_9HYPH|nr:PLP-dependent aminotransferase family protein [Fererhizobium litorale]MDI7863317.1 PLP-dependent aminotransferase family protein [Fererhizobium litorale]MDI7922949.1 PLP-dependent aminotransferase family protein [Fererhizobium litorale]
MTTWLPDLSGGTGPLYLRLADSIESAIASGTLPAGSKLPPQRNLAFDLKVTIGTIGRAYALVHERGLVSGEVGRGTYVLAHNENTPTEKSDPAAASLAGTRAIDAPPGKIRFDTTAAPEVGQGEVLGRILGDIARDHPLEIASYSRSFPGHWMEAGQRWLSRNGWRPEVEDVVPTLGAHAAAIAIIASVTSPGDKIVFENLTYTQVSRSARLLGRRTILVNSDDDGMVPDDFERVCAQQHPKLAFLMPTAHNPTLSVIPEDRRRAIADIARRHGVWLIEDDLYGAMSGDRNPLLAAFAPERTFVVSGLSKSVSAGVRGGWAACPAHYSQRIKVAHKMMTGGISFALAETGARLVLSGAASELRDRCTAEIAERERFAREVLAGFDFRSHPSVPFIWLKLPEPWLSGTFKNAAYQEGVMIDDEDEFKAARTEKVYHRVRVGYSSTPDRTELTQGFTILRRLLENGFASYDGDI